jgi:hypothetical protein
MAGGITFFRVRYLPSDAVLPVRSKGESIRSTGSTTPDGKCGSDDKVFPLLNYSGFEFRLV